MRFLWTLGAVVLGINGILAILLSLTAKAYPAVGVVIGIAMVLAAVAILTHWPWCARNPELAFVPVAIPIVVAGGLQMIDGEIGLLMILSSACGLLVLTLAVGTWARRLYLTRRSGQR